MGDYNFDGLFEICAKHGAELHLDEKLAPYTSFKIGGPCSALVKAANENSLVDSVSFCKDNGITYRVIGRGSNILVSDKGFGGVVIVAGGTGAEVKGEVIECYAGATLSYVCRCARENSLTGLEFAYGIPGTVGGAVYMNAGAYGGEMSDVVSRCRFLGADGKIHEISGKDAEFAYRHSIFSENKGIILSAVIKLQKGEKHSIMSKMTELSEKRREKQPLDYPSAGSTFKRPAGDFAARLIDECELKGFACGGAMVSEKHAGFVINTGGATFDDVMRVIVAVKETVFRKTGVMLECEVEIWE